MAQLKTQRYVALDVLRGMTVAGMILVNNPGTWSKIFPPLRHAAWAGCTPTDLVFPFFLFVVGAAMAFSFAKYNEGLTPDSVKKWIGKRFTPLEEREDVAFDFSASMCSASVPQQPPKIHTPHAAISST